MLRRLLARLPLIDRPPKVPIRDLDRRDQAVFTVGVGLAIAVGFIVTVAVLFMLGLIGIIDAQANSTGDFALILWVVSAYLLGLVATDWVRERARGRER